MSHPSELKRLIVEAVYSELPKPYYPEWLGPSAQGTNEMTIDDLVGGWFLTPNREGMRLTTSGNAAFAAANLECFVFTIESHFHVGWVGWYGRLLDMSKKIKCPYFLGMKKNSWSSTKVLGGTVSQETPHIRIYDSKIAMMIGLYGNMKEYLESLDRIQSGST